MNQYLTRFELAERWKCSLTTIRRMEKRGDLNPIRLSGRLVRFALSGIEKVEREARCDFAS
jgi:excisionase family DNA binding protein